MTVLANVAAIVATLRQELRVLHADLSHRHVDQGAGEAAPSDRAHLDPLRAGYQDLYGLR